MEDEKNILILVCSACKNDKMIVTNSNDTIVMTCSACNKLTFKIVVSDKVLHTKTNELN